MFTVFKRLGYESAEERQKGIRHITQPVKRDSESDQQTPTLPEKTIPDPLSINYVPQEGRTKESKG